jgi:hypothetical protein
MAAMDASNAMDSTEKKLLDLANVASVQHSTKATTAQHAIKVKLFSVHLGAPHIRAGRVNTNIALWRYRPTRGAPLL